MKRGTGTRIFRNPDIWSDQKQPGESFSLRWSKGKREDGSRTEAEDEFRAYGEMRDGSLLGMLDMQEL